MSEQKVRLTDPFPQSAVGKLPKMTCRDCGDRKTECAKHRKKKCRECGNYLGEHIHIDYVGHAHVTERLLQVDPNWTWEPLATNGDGMPRFDNAGGLWIRLTVNGQTKIGYGDADGRQDSGLAVKIAIGDALRNAAMRFGVALDLWKKETPELVGDVPVRQVERPKEQTEDEKKRELRGQIAAVARSRGRGIEETAADFHQWSRGTSITDASVAVLLEYREHLQNRGGS